MKGEEVVAVTGEDDAEWSTASSSGAEEDIRSQSDAPGEKEQKQPPNLMTLPPEILQNILWHMEPGAYFTCLQTCKTLHTDTGIRKLLLHQISHLPGLRLGLDDLRTDELFQTFRSRAARSAVAADVFSDISQYDPISPASRMNKCALVHGPIKPPYLAVPIDHQRINVYWLGSKFVRLKAYDLKPRERKSKDLEIVHMAFSEGKDLAVLYSTKPSSRQRSIFDGRPRSKRKYKLVTFLYTKTSNRSSFYKNSMQETRDITPDHSDALPVGMALANNGTACITWQRSKDYQKTEVWLYGRHKEILDNTSHGAFFKSHDAYFDPKPSSFSGLISRIIAQADINADPCPRSSMLPTSTTHFRKKQDNLIFNPQFSPSSHTLILHSPGVPIYSWYSNHVDPSTTSSTLDGTIMENIEAINLLPAPPQPESSTANQDDDAEEDDPEAEWEDFRVGVPFSGLHSRVHDTLCRTSYLCLGIAPHLDYPGSNVFVLHTEFTNPPAICSHSSDCWEGRRVVAGAGRRAIAILADYTQKSDSSIGSVMATSPNGMRIAAAAWQEVKVWTIAPSIFHQADHNLLQQWFPARDFNPRRSIGRLRPVTLPTHGVVHKLCWESEEILYAVCDNGLVKWDLGHLCSGDRESLALLHDACGSMNMAALGRHVNRKGKVRIEGLSTSSEEDGAWDEEEDRPGEDSPEDD